MAHRTLEERFALNSTSRYYIRDNNFGPWNPNRHYVLSDLTLEQLTELVNSKRYGSCEVVQLTAEQSFIAKLSGLNLARKPKRLLKSLWTRSSSVSKSSRFKLVFSEPDAVNVFSFRSL